MVLLLKACYATEQRMTQVADWINFDCKCDLLAFYVFTGKICVYYHNTTMNYMNYKAEDDVKVEHRSRDY